MKIQGFSKEGNWYKGNLHSHTTESDGKMTPDKAAEAYHGAGYHFICFSDHDRYTDWREQLDRKNFIILPGLEASVWLKEETEPHSWIKAHHIHGILGPKRMQQNSKSPLWHHREKIDPPTFYGEWNGAFEAQKMCDRIRDKGCFTIYNHPNWSRVREEEFLNTEGLWALEIFNYGTDQEDGTGTDVMHWDVLLREGRRIFAVAADDNHREDLKDAFGGFVVVKAPELSHEAITDSLLTGNYYSSSGPAIYDWGIQDGIAFVKCSPVYRINFVAGNRINDGASYFAGSYDETLEEANYPLEGHETYIRVECCDCYGRTAWSNPIFLNEQVK
ncbi:MAG: CehA/McbA family metallohydrolase [Lachnospiraceae bacterium]|nr:CehA/McbA family metallohydrolase [Lachnospiraceae bacterium]